MASKTRRGFAGPFAKILNRYRNLRWWWRYLIVSSVAVICAGGVGAAGLILYYGQLAGRESLADLGKMPQRSIVLDRNGEIIGRLHGSNRIVVSVDEVSPLFVDALIAREDSRFFRHGGIDYYGIARAMLRNLKEKRLVQGASTITMQLARNSYFGSDRTLHRKLLEAMMARRIEKHYSKREILTHYVNRIYFGAGLYGIERATQAYFHKPPRDMTIGEAALLAGIIRAPSRLSPVNHYEDALRERNAVLERMVIEGFASEEEAQEARSEKLEVYFVDPAREQENYALDAVRRDLDFFLEESEVEDGGFEIHTTIDLRIQEAAQAALESRLVELENSSGFRHLTKAAFERAFHTGEPTSTEYVQGAVVVLDNESGAILAVIGGRDFEHNKYNRALLARRQIGSAFKPFVYATAFESGFMPGSLIDDSAIAPGEIPGSAEDWSPRNSDGNYTGLQPIEWGLIKSRNTMSVRLGAAVGIDRVIAKARVLGLDPDPARSPQIYIGNLGATLKALTSAYSIFPNGGVMRRPYTINRIEKIGGGLLRATPVVETPVLSPGAAWMTSAILQEVIDKGTAAQARSMGLKVPAGGKTGTTNGYTDAWFVGYTSRLSAGVWVGLDTPGTIIDRGYGSRLALPIWVDIMKAAESLGYPAGSLDPTIPFTKVELCRVNGQLATEACRLHETAYVQELPFEQIPRYSCTFHGAQLVDTTSRRIEPPPRKGVVKRFLNLFR